MSKLGQAALTEAVADELILYLRNGTINERSVARTLDITDLNITDLDRLKRIHFCLSDDVVTFIERLQSRLRRVKTANQREREETRGEVRGAIDWQATTRLRYSDGTGDRTRFSCKTPYTEYDIDENLVLKRLLWEIHTTVQDDIQGIGYDWRTAAWPSERITMFDRVYARNVHLNRIRDGNAITVSQRMLEAARSSRQPLYTEAYTLYDRYRRLIEGMYDDADVSKLLTDTLVVPERLPRLFELFCVFKLLRIIDSDQLQLQAIEPGAKELATFEGPEFVIDVYHDRTGGLTFYERLPKREEVSLEYFHRYLDALERHEAMVKEFLGNDTNNVLLSGRPDFVLEVYDQADYEVPTDVVIGEIKYSNSTQTFTQGLKELSIYIEFAQRNGYLTDNDVNIRGLLMTDGVETETPSVLDGAITHLNAADLFADESPVSWIPEQVLKVVHSGEQPEAVHHG